MAASSLIPVVVKVMDSVAVTAAGAVTGTNRYINLISAKLPPPRAPRGPEGGGYRGVGGEGG